MGNILDYYDGSIYNGKTHGRGKLYYDKEFKKLNMMEIGIMVKDMNMVNHIGIMVIYNMMENGKLYKRRYGYLFSASLKYKFSRFNREKFHRTAMKSFAKIYANAYILREPIHGLSRNRTWATCSRSMYASTTLIAL